GLDAVDRGLHLGVEVLHAEAGAVEAERAQRANVGGVGVARVELDREVAGGRVREAEVGAQRVQQLAQLRRRQEVGGAAAQVQLDHFAVAVEQRGGERDL